MKLLIFKHKLFISKIFGILFSLLIITNVNAQNSFYLNPNVGIVWNSYDNSNPNITGNEDVANIFWDNDWFFNFMFGYNFKYNLTLESGIEYHNAVNRYHLNYEGLTDGGGSFVSFGEGFLSIPINIKYNINTKIKRLKIVPYVGISLSTHKINSNPYVVIHNVNYEGNSMTNNPIPEDTTSIVKAYRPNKTNLLINGGLGLEYVLFKNITFTLYANFTAGFVDMNKLSVEVLFEDESEYGDIVYRGNKFYLTGGIKIPICKRE
jgi:hypothetical protein